MSLKELGELGIIRILESILGSSARTAIGFGDDVSAVKLGSGKVAVLKTDMLVGSTDVPLGMTFRQAARKAVVANVSDLAAKGVRPLAGLVALGLPANMAKRDLHGLAFGLRDGEREYGFPLVGGDTNESQDLTISIALFAIAEHKRLVLRDGAKIGDIVAVTGAFGSTSAGLKSLLDKKKRPRQLPTPLYKAVFMPRAQLKLGVKLADSGALTASIDSSDGLAWSFHELCQASRVGMRIDEVPIDRAAKNFALLYNYDATELALYGGEEYHLVVTVKPNKFDLARRIADGKMWQIGTVTERSEGITLKRNGNYVKIPRKGWEHFRRYA